MFPNECCPRPECCTCGVTDGPAAYVRDALRSLTRAQRQYVKRGCIHGDCTMRTIRELRRKGLFYLKITSPNGQCGHMELTPLGVSVRAILNAAQDVSSTSREVGALANTRPRSILESTTHSNEGER